MGVVWGWVLRLIPSATMPFLKSVFTGKGGVVWLLGIALALGGIAGWKVNEWRWEAKQNNATQQLIAEHKVDLKIRDDIVEQLREAKNEIEVQERVIEKEIIKYIQTPAASEPCLTDDELLLFNGE